MAERKEMDRRELCAAASEERDSEKLLSLVYQILEAFNQLDLESGRSERRLTSRCTPESSGEGSALN
jgi:hypothetical protein